MRMKTKLLLPIVSMSAVIALGLGMTALGQEPVSSPVRQGPKVLISGEHGIGGMVSDFEFKDLSGKTHRLGDFSNQKAIVIAMTSTSCPLSKKYLPTLGNYCW